MTRLRLKVRIQNQEVFQLQSADRVRHVSRHVSYIDLTPQRRAEGNELSDERYYGVELFTEMASSSREKKNRKKRNKRLRHCRRVARPLLAVCGRIGAGLEPCAPAIG